MMLLLMDAAQHMSVCCLADNLSTLCQQHGTKCSVASKMTDRRMTDGNHLSQKLSVII